MNILIKEGEKKWNGKLNTQTSGKPIEDMLVNNRISPWKLGTGLR